MSDGIPGHGPDSLDRSSPGGGHRVLLVAATDAPGPRTLFRAPFGLLRVNAGIRRSGVEAETRIVEWNRFHRSEGEEQAFKALLRAFSPAVVGLSAFSFYMPAAIQLARWVRECDERIPIVLGGPHATSFPDDVGRFEMFDYFVRGDGGTPFSGLLRALLDGESPLGTVPGLTYRRSGAVRRSPDCETAPSLDEEPPVDWTDLDLSSYDHNLLDVFGPIHLENITGPFVPYKASAGCTFRCSFCERVSGSRLRFHSPGRVVEDLRRLGRLFPGAVVEFLDECVDLDRKWFGDFLAGLASIEPPDRLRYVSMVRADILDRETIDRMAEVGFVVILCFPESGSARIRGLMNKHFDIDALLANVAYARSRGLVTWGSALVGWPGETEEDFEATCRLGQEPCFDLFVFNPLIYFAGTAVGRESLHRLGLEPSSPEYFESLLAPERRTLAAYGVERYAEILRRSKALSLATTTNPETVARLARVGLRLVEMDGRDPAHLRFVPTGTTGPLTGPRAAGDPRHLPGPEGEFDDPRLLRLRIGELERQVEELVGARHRLDLLLGQIAAGMSSPGWQVRACRIDDEHGAGEERRFKLTLVVESPSAAVELHVEMKGPDRCWFRTRLFNLSYSSGPGTPNAAQSSLLNRLVERISQWEMRVLSGRGGSPAAPGGRAPS